MPGLTSAGAPPPLILEGEFTTWTKLWEWSIAEGAAGRLYVDFAFDADHVIFGWEDGDFHYRLVVINIADGSVKFLSPAGEHYETYYPYVGTKDCFVYNSAAYIVGGASVSVRGKYVVIGKGTGENMIEVWKDGSKAWTSETIDKYVTGAAFITAIGIRHDGKYVLVTTDNDVLLCFEGS